MRESIRPERCSFADKVMAANARDRLEDAATQLVERGCGADPVMKKVDAVQKARRGRSPLAVSLRQRYVLSAPVGSGAALAFWIDGRRADAPGNFCRSQIHPAD